MDIYLAKKMSLVSFSFKVNNDNIRHQRSQNICARAVFSVAHTEHTLPLAKAHRQRPTNTHCTFSHIQTKNTQKHTHSARRSALLFYSQFYANGVMLEDHRQSVIHCCGWLNPLHSSVIVHTCNCQKSKPRSVFLLLRVTEKLLQSHLNNFSFVCFLFLYVICCTVSTKTSVEVKKNRLIVAEYINSHLHRSKNRSILFCQVSVTTYCLKCETVSMCHRLKLTIC